MKTKNKNAVKNLLEIRADIHSETFGKSITWEIKNMGTKEEPNWNVNIYENHSTLVSFNYEIIGMIAMTAMVSQLMDLVERNGVKVIRFHLY